MVDNRAAFDFFLSATAEEIEELGWRIGEKLDDYFGDDFIKNILNPFIIGVRKGSGRKEIVEISYV